MELSPRVLVWLQHEMEGIKNDPSCCGEDRKHASSMIGHIEEELEYRERSHNDKTPHRAVLPDGGSEHGDR